MTTYSADYSPLVFSHVHVDVTSVDTYTDRSSYGSQITHVKFVYFAFVRYDDNYLEVIPLFGKDQDCISVPMYRSNDRDYVLSVALDAITMRYGDTDQDYFSDYTESEFAWATSWLCDALQAEYEHV